MRRHPSLYHLPLLASLALLPACGGDSPFSGGDGRIQVTVFTDGGEEDVAGYTVVLDGSQILVVEPDGTVVFDGVGEGEHIVSLSSIPTKCALARGSNPLRVTVQSGSTTAANFNLLCDVGDTGGFRIVVTTVGGPLDEDGYQLSVAGTPLRTIGTTAAEVYSDLAPGMHLITLKDVVPHCKLQGGNPQPFTVVPGKSVLVNLVVLCGEQPPTQ
jgi:hypothetical protein